MQLETKPLKFEKEIQNEGGQNYVGQRGIHRKIIGEKEEDIY